MKFIFPKNYKYRAKILGFIDYVTAIVDLLIGIILFFMIHMFVTKITTRNLYFYCFICSHCIVYCIDIKWREYHIIFTTNHKIFKKKRCLFLYKGF